MALSRFRTLHRLLAPHIVKWGGIVLAVFGSYDVISNQAPSLQLPKLGDLLLRWAGMSGSLLPWWGWLLLLQAVFIYALFEYVRRNVPPRADASDRVVAFIGGDLTMGVCKESDLALHQQINRVGNQAQERIAEFNNSLNGRILQLEQQQSSLGQAINDAKIDGDTHLDLCQLLYFALLESTVAMLDKLIEGAPEGNIPRNQSGDAVDDAYEAIAGDLPLTFHPAAIRASAVDTPSGAG